MAVTRESLQEKADRLLVAGHVTVVHVLGQELEARVVGDSSTYRTGYRRSGWYCTCERRQHGRGRACSHLLAVQKIAGKTAKQQRAS